MGGRKRRLKARGTKSLVCAQRNDCFLFHRPLLLVLALVCLLGSGPSLHGCGKIRSLSITTQLASNGMLHGCVNACEGNVLCATFCAPLPWLSPPPLFFVWFHVQQANIHVGFVGDDLVATCAGHPPLYLGTYPDLRANAVDGESCIFLLL